VKRVLTGWSSFFSSNSETGVESYSLPCAEGLSVPGLSLLLTEVYHRGKRVINTLRITHPDV